MLKIDCKSTRSERALSRNPGPKQTLKVTIRGAFPEAKRAPIEREYHPTRKAIAVAPPAVPLCMSHRAERRANCPHHPFLSAVTPLLQVENVTKSFGAVRALRGVSFELHAGEVHALLGENGAGKSTLIKIVTGAHSPDAGFVSLLGEPMRHFNPRESHRLGITCVYQQPALFPDLTVAENIALRLSQPRAFSFVSTTAQRERALALLRQIGADIAPEREIRSLSMPEQQLVEIACAIGSGARIVIMQRII